MAQGMVFEEGTKTLLLAGLGLTAVTIFAKPVINLMLLPLNLVTYGLFRWVSSGVALFLVELIIPKFSINNFLFSGLTNRWFDLPLITLQGIPAYIAFAFILSFITSILFWLLG
jgi:uncharacterized membrane protein YvlD (DUF360 family)